MSYLDPDYFQEVNKTISSILTILACTYDNTISACFGSVVFP